MRRRKGHVRPSFGRLSPVSTTTMSVTRWSSVQPFMNTRAVGLVRCIIPSSLSLCHNSLPLRHTPPDSHWTTTDVGHQHCKEPMDMHYRTQPDTSRIHGHVVNLHYHTNQSNLHYCTQPFTTTHGHGIKLPYPSVTSRIHGHVVNLHCRMHPVTTRIHGHGIKLHYQTQSISTRIYGHGIKLHYPTQAVTPRIHGHGINLHYCTQ